MDKTNRIKLPVGGIDLVAKLMNVTRRSVFRALSGRGAASPLALRIRRCALNHGGYFVRADIPEGQWLTEYNHAAGWMVAQFWNGYVVRVSLRGGPMEVGHPDGTTEQRPEPSIGDVFTLFEELALKQPSNDI